ncbi:MAG: nicotinate-nucleotide adenylyltransferase [Clostridia bacterium]|nr:nicotinate-nucleotide adenylyltransferase [Clostridia bacterium]
MQTIGLMGGSFNPVHCGHLNLARRALLSGRVDSVLFLPTGNPPHKHAELADKMDRLAMVRLAVEGEAGMGVSREEIDRDGVIYTIDTLGNLAGRMPDCRFIYLIGADTLRVLHTWKRVQDVIGRCGFLVMMREGEPEQEVLDLAESWRGRGAQVELLAARKMDISSTEIRRRVREGLPLAGLVPPAVDAYIAAHGLYQTGEEPQPMKREKMVYKLKKTLDAQRFIHTLGVEATARKMAVVFGEDEEKAALAGLLHDCAKCMPLSQMVKAAKGVPLDPVMKESKALMHAVAGRCVAESVYGVKDEEVLSAIRWHTTGHADMTRLEKIIYLADMIEPNRKPYPGLDQLRELCMRDLDLAMHQALRMSLEHVQEQGKALHPDTLAALESYERQLTRVR